VLGGESGASVFLLLPRPSPQNGEKYEGIAPDRKRILAQQCLAHALSRRVREWNAFGG